MRRACTTQNGRLTGARSPSCLVPFHQPLWCFTPLQAHQVWVALQEANLTPRGSPNFASKERDRHSKKQVARNSYVGGQVSV